MMLSVVGLKLGAGECVAPFGSEDGRLVERLETDLKCAFQSHTYSANICEIFMYLCKMLSI